MSGEKLAWAAGLFEGEGTVGISKKGKPFMALGMTDRDVVERFREAVGFGVVDEEERRGGRRRIYKWRGDVQAQQAALLRRMWPLLGDRRRHQAAPLIDRMQRLDTRRCQCGCGVSLKGRLEPAQFASSGCWKRYRYARDPQLAERIRQKQRDYNAIAAQELLDEKAAAPRMCLCGCGEDITFRRADARVASQDCRNRAVRAGLL